ncbi:MAG: response regulator [candidate division Zixibacteria bacterium]|nr:response regulator [candidate division Zixibacteria bacterium]
MSSARILVADDDSLMREFVMETLNRIGYEVDGVADGESAITALQKVEYDLVITDIKMPGSDGMEVLRAAKSVDPCYKVILMTAYGTIDSAVSAMKEGAFDYLTKGQKTSPDEIELVVARALEFQKLETENKRLKTELSDKYSFSNIVGRSPKMQQVFDMIQTVARSSASVLITGKSGSGKELVARGIHYNSPRREHPFIKLNCAALPDGLVETELFGHEKGAFTGAVKAVKGRFEIANKGTLLLDEISEMSVSMQAKLLRVLQEREFERVGSGQTIQTDVRIIATSNRNLKDEVRKGQFREDLYYRLNVIPINLPTLAERIEDIPLLANHFAALYARKNEKNIEGITEDAKKMLCDYNWPGNVRELENFVERAVVVSQNYRLDVEDFPPQLITAPQENIELDWVRPGVSLYEMEKQLILRTIEAEGGNRTRASEILGVTTRTLRNKLHEYGVGPKRRTED